MRTGTRAPKPQEITVQNEMTAAVTLAYGNTRTAVMFQGEVRESELLGTALTGASKSSKGGDGVPEAAIFYEGDECSKLPSLTKPVALIECKSKGGIKKAQKEAQHYVRHCWAKSNIFIPLAIGFDSNEITVDFFVESENTFKPCRFPDGSSFAERWKKTKIWPTQDELLAASWAPEGYIQNSQSLMEIAFTKDFIKRINATMQNKSVDITDRVVLFTGFLIACRSPGFKNLTTTSVEFSVEEFGDQVFQGYRAAVKKAPKEIQTGLLAFENFLAPLLKTNDGQPSPNGANAIHEIAFGDIPAICSKHALTPDRLIDEINDNMFNVVDVYDAFQAYAPSNDLGKYFTPRHIVKAMIRLVEQFRGNGSSGNLTDTDIVYDPACGVGGFLVGALERVAQTKTEGPDRAIIKREFGRRLMGIDQDGKIAAIARINLWLHGDGTSGIYQSDSLDRSHAIKKPKPRIGDLGMGEATPLSHKIHDAVSSLSRKIGGEARPTVVLMNPPFPTKENKTHESFEFVEHGLKQLVEGGHLCAVVPATSIVKEDALHTKARKRILEHAQLLAVVALPPDLFAPGASVNTYLMLLKKQHGGHKLNESVLFARCPDDGFVMDKASKRRNRPAIGDEAEQKKRRWIEDEGFGGDLAELLAYTKRGETNGDWWVSSHRFRGGVNLARQAISANLPSETKEKGLEWSPEKFIHDQVDHAELLRLANRIYAEVQAFEVVKTVGGIW